MRWPVDQADLENILNVSVRDISSYQQAFVHKSAVKIVNCDSYERLEYLGDAVIGLAVNEFLFRMYPNEREGFMTRLKTKLVSGECLSALASKLKLDAHIVMNRKALDEGWASNPNMLEDCLEALVGALYLDVGWETAKAFVVSLLERHIDFDSLELMTNAKDALMAYCQQHDVPLPIYTEIKIPSGTPTAAATKFAIETVVHGVTYGLGTGRTKKEAEQMSAQTTLENLGVPHQQARAYVV